MRLGLIGYGAMGKAIKIIAEKRGHKVVSIVDINHDQWDDHVDCYIDFSTALALSLNIEHICHMNIPIVIGTTGWYHNLEQYQTLFVEKKIKGIWGSNFSLGVNIFMSIVEDAAKKVSNYGDLYDVFLHEFHHREKTDSPSGTALKLAALVNENYNTKDSIQTARLDTKIQKNELHTTSTRGGYITGTHQVIFDSPFGSIELTDRARSKDGFALGAVIAAENIAKLPLGLHDFYEVFKDFYK